MDEFQNFFPLNWRTVSLLETKKFFGEDSTGLLQPTPICLGNGRIRIYCGLRDRSGVSRIHFIEIDEKKPFNILEVSSREIVSLGANGFFDDNGMVPTCISKTPDEWLLFYAGYQLVSNVKFLAFGGALRSEDGKTFERTRTTPIMDRKPGEEYFRVPHSVAFLSESKEFEIYYGAGNVFSWNIEKQVVSPVYDIRETRTKDWVNFSESRILIPLEAGELRVGRPNVINFQGQKFMLFTSFTLSKSELVVAGICEKSSWERLGTINIESEGFPDKNMRGYPSMLTCHGQNILFYNGDNYGRDGILIAEPL